MSEILSYFAFVFLRCVVFKELLWKLLVSDGDKGIRTLDPLLARQVLSQLSYVPGCNGVEWTRTIDLTLIRRVL